MKKIFAIAICLLGLAGTHAQPVEEAEGSTPPETSTAVDINAEENKAMNEMNAIEPQQPAAPAVQQPQPATAGDHGQLFINLFLLGLAAGALGLAIMGRKDAAAARKQHEGELEELKTSVEKEHENLQDALRRMEQRIIELERQQATASGGTAAATVSKPNALRQRQASRSAGPQTFYLTRPDEHGFFMSASNTFERGNSIFQLSTSDGKNGTFIVIDNDEVHRLALMMPTENLTRACTGNNIQVSNGKNRIVTDTAGRATLENGRWRIVTMAAIHYTT